MTLDDGDPILDYYGNDCIITYTGKKGSTVIKAKYNNKVIASITVKVVKGTKIVKSKLDPGFKKKITTQNLNITMEPHTVVKYDGKTLKEFFDYTMCVDDKIGPSEAWLKPCGKYDCDTYQIKYDVIMVPKGTTIKSLTAKSKGFTVKWGKRTVRTTGYQIRYSTNSDMSDAVTKLITSKDTVSKTISNLKANKKYYIQVRTYKTVKGKKYYSFWSAKKTVTTKN